MSEPTPTREQRLERLFDDYLTQLEDIIRRGEPLTDESGNAVTDDRGFAVFKVPSASHLKRAAELFDKLNIGAVKSADSGISETIRGFKERGWKIGGVDVAAVPDSLEGEAC
jgi:hypothetical protein